MSRSGIKVRTVLGDIDSKALGHTQCHEHLFLEMGPSFNVTSVLLMEDTEKTTAELLDYRKAGGGTVVDAQPALCGRMARSLVEAARRSHVHIIASTGFHKREFYPSDCSLFDDSFDSITAMFLRELNEELLPAIQDTEGAVPCRAGIVKVALPSEKPGADAVTQKMLEAAITAAISTGSALLCHTDPGIRPLDWIDWMTRYGLNADRIILSHLDRTASDIHTIKESLAAGIYLTLDTIHRYKYRDDLSERRLIADLIQAGGGSRIMLSLDTTNRRLRHYGGEIGLDYILCSFMSVLRSDGISETDLYQMTVANAANVLPLRP